MTEKKIVSVLVKYHPCSPYARGSVCPFFKMGSRRCSKLPDQCDMPEYDKWFKDVLIGKIRYFHSPRNIHILKASGVPLLIYHSLKRKIIGEAAVNKMTKENDIYYYWFDNFIHYPKYVDPDNIKTDKSLQRAIYKGNWSFRYLTEETLKEIRCYAGLSPEVKQGLNKKIKKIKAAIEALPVSRSRLKHRAYIGQIILKEAGLKYHIDGAIIDKAKYFLEEATEKGLLKGRSITDVAFTSLFIAYRTMGNPITVKEFSNKYGLHPRRVSRIYREMVSSLRLTMPRLEAENYIVKCSQGLPVSEETVRTALSFVKSLKKCIPGKSPRVIAATSFYVACKANHEKLTQKRIAKTFGVSEPSIRKYWKLLKMKVSIRSLTNK